MQDYEPKFWYFEVLELFRKYLLTGIGIILAPDTIVQVVFNVIIVLAAAVVYLTARPYVNDSDDTVNTVAQWAMFIQLFAEKKIRGPAATNAHGSAGLHILRRLVRQRHSGAVHRRRHGAGTVCDAHDRGRVTVVQRVGAVLPTVWTLTTTWCWPTH